MPKIVDHEQRRMHIAAALMRVAADSGLAAVSLRTVAAEAGVTSGMVQHYFPTKDAMMTFAMDQANAGFATRLTTSIEGLGANPAPRDIVRATLMMLLPDDEQARTDARVGVAFLASAASDRSRAIGLGEQSADLRAFLTEQIERARARGELRSELSPAVLALSLHAAAEGFGLHMVSADLDGDLAREALDAMLNEALGKR